MLTINTVLFGTEVLDNKRGIMLNTIKYKQPELLETRPNNHDRVNQILWNVLIVNILVAGAKIGVGLITNSISMLADGFHSAMDGSSNVMGLIGAKIANQPPDKNHPYGHQKYETFATLGIGLLLLFTSWQVLQNIGHRLLEGSTPEVTPLSFSVMAITIIVNIVITTYESRWGRTLNSSILLADAEHTRSDIFVSLSVLVSLIAVSFGWLWIDVLIALVIVFVIGRTGWQIVKQASDVLTDCAVVDPDVVEKITLSVDGVKSCHKIRSRGTDQMVHLDLHIQVDGHLTLEAAHELGHVTQTTLEQKLGITDILVHVEPMR